MTLAVTGNCRTQFQDYVANETVTAGKASSNGPQDFLGSDHFSNGNNSPTDI
jgi:hypothetical protein